MSDKSSESSESSEKKMTKDSNGENAPHLEITETILVQYNIAKNDYQKDSKFLHTFVQISHLVNYEKLHQKILFF